VGRFRWLVPITAVVPLLVVLALAGQAGEQVCGALAGAVIPADEIGLPTTGAVVEAADVRPATNEAPQHCEVQGWIRPVDPAAPGVRFRIGLPEQWNGNALHVGGGGYNGTVPAVTGNVPSAPPGTPTPLARGYAVFGSDSGHQGGNASFAVDDEAMVDFGYAALKKTRDVAVEIMRRHYGDGPGRTYFAGSSQGGREAVTVAQRFPEDYDGVLSRVPVLNFTGLHISDYDGCEHDPAELACPPGGVADTCLTEAQVEMVRTVRSPLEFSEPVANGVTEYPRWPTGHESGWTRWMMGDAGASPDQAPGADPGGPPVANYGAQFVRFFLAQDPNISTRGFDPDDPRWRERIAYVSSVVDSTDPDLSAFHASGGKLIVQEAMGDYGRSGYAGIGYVESVREELGAERADEFLRLYAAPGADHGGLGAPALVDWLTVLEDWVERDQAPGDLVAAQTGEVNRTIPACRYPEWPRYEGGDPSVAASYTCATD
jgi:hypothetical protein